MSYGSRRQFLLQATRTTGVLGIGTLPIWSRASASFVDSTELTAKAVDFLRSRQTTNGSWSSDRDEPGITGLVLTALLRSKRLTPNDPVITKGLAHLEGLVSDGGGLSKVRHSSYSTCVALMAFHEANRNGRYVALIKGAQQFLRSTQFDETNGTTRDNPYYGGAGYGPGTATVAPPQAETQKKDTATVTASKAETQKKDTSRTPRPPRPDLSNTAFMIEALRNSGVPANDPAMQKALVFISRCQNLKSEFNDQPWAEKVNDGGFIYTTANGGTSMAGKNDDGSLRSYASMTYAGLRSLIYAGLTPDDSRVKAAHQYLVRNYSVEENPGLAQRGLYYYYQAFAKTLAALGNPALVDSQGKSHDWRADLIGALSKRQASNGSWVNTTDGFMEGDANLVTAYGILALTYAAAKS